MSYKNLKSDFDKKYAEIIRVNQAGEFGAKRIYEGQLAILKGNKSYKVIKKMAKQEEKHLQTFNKIMINEGIRPTVLSPIWDIGGFLLGVSSAAISEEAAMACTVAVEEVIDKHYESQENYLKQHSNKKLLKTIKKFRKEEIEHKHSAIENNALKAKNYKILTKGIKTLTKVAILLSKKI